MFYDLHRHRREISLSPFYLGFLNLGCLPGCAGGEEGRKTGRESQGVSK